MERQADRGQALIELLLGLLLVMSFFFFAFFSTETFLKDSVHHRFKRESKL